ncbi:helix-turn-helix transcriptional regulator [Shewanella psychropiezotolerans]|uniref:Helix-turn-helix protein n=2 Tax=Shewanella TaxID=22 RepID=A0A1S6HXB0_9GAMM|nr:MULTISPECIES: helix-turn-helix transcriptional regulator [Shewanella]AQS40207.1 Helix-turn-helix protein [Shewanella psychrophila]QDO84520.1 helix-turn-helix transcriptional regulator [Shewanella psychropiezotolerans]
MSPKTIITIIKNKRIESKMTQKDLAQKIGMSEKTYQRIESEAVDMRLSQYYNLITALGLTELDVILDSFNVDTVTDKDIVAATRLLLPQTRHNLVHMIISEFQRFQNTNKSKV